MKKVTTRKKPVVKPTVDPEIFVESAKLLDLVRAGGCCGHISKAIDARSGVRRDIPYESYESPHHRFFETVLNSRKSTTDCWYRDPIDGFPYETYPQTVAARIMGLLLCAELAREGFVPEGFIK